MIHSRMVVPFRVQHFLWLNGAVETLDGVEVTAGALRLMEGQNAYTAVVDGEPVAMAGTVQHWAGRHTSWACMGRASGPHMRWITRHVRDNLAQLKGRIEMTVRSDFQAGHKWARLLGFRVETPVLSYYGPAGEDHVGYVRIN